MNKPRKSKPAPSARPAPQKKERKKVAVDPTIERMKRFIRSRGSDYLKDDNVTSIGIGYRVVDGKPTKEVALQFCVQRKAAPEVLEALGEPPLPRNIVFEGVALPTDVVQRSFRPGYVIVESLAKDDRKQRMDPVTPGISVANVNATAGTLGALVRDRLTGETVALSNWHVLHTTRGAIGDAVVQPGPWDDNRIDANRLGVLLRSHLGVAGDCAIASIEGRRREPNVLGVDVAVRRIGKPELDDPVVKSGRTTAVTYGIVTRIDTLTRIDYGDGVVAQIGGFEIGPDPKRRAPANEISRGGDSGSTWLAMYPNGKPSDIAVGLHFGGDAEDSDGEFALACYAHAVFEKLEIEPLPATGASDIAHAEGTVREDLRAGFSTSFLDFAVPEPGFKSHVRSDLATLGGAQRIDYCHFSLWLSKSRKLARAVAWNIDGASLKSLSRKGIRFVKDERGNLENYQFGDELYAGNPLDRGHIARRADLCWGPIAEARQANRDSFCFTNIAPQHERFNQSGLGGLWGQLEDAIFEDVDIANLRVSLMGGPILRSGDPQFGDKARLPREFWKIAAYKDDADGKAKLRAYILTQADLVRDLAPESLELDAFRWYQVPLARIEQETGLNFAPGLSALDQYVAQPQALGQGRN
ncbi:MAG TPA: DNA/RNA non-specific endonuclease, partial [Tahibacter sp.]|nr:DNA/RNA non-specific endonuclease [Tahibacter sp.]